MQILREKIVFNLHQLLAVKNLRMQNNPLYFSRIINPLNYWIAMKLLDIHILTTYACALHYPYILLHKFSKEYKKRPGFSLISCYLYSSTKNYFCRRLAVQK